MPHSKFPDQPIRVAAEAAFESLTQQRQFKPTHVYHYGDSAGTEWWRQVLGCTFSEYYLRHFVGAVLTYIEIDVFDVRVMPQDPLTVEFSSPLGRYESPAGRPPRYGGQDRITLLTADERPIARLTSAWLWFRTPPDAKPGTLSEPPPEFPHAQAIFEAPPAAPDVEGEFAGSFRWSPRETDLNQHVNSMAFLERAENALADAAIARAPTGRLAAWYMKPGFEGELMEARVDPRTASVKLTSADKGHACAVARFTPL